MNRLSAKWWICIVAVFVFATTLGFGFQQASAGLCYCNCSNAWCQYSNGGLGGWIEGTLTTCGQPASGCNIDVLRCQGCYPY